MCLGALANRTWAPGGISSRTRSLVKLTRLLSADSKEFFCGNFRQLSWWLSRCCGGAEFPGCLIDQWCQILAYNLARLALNWTNLGLLLKSPRFVQIRALWLIWVESDISDDGFKLKVSRFTHYVYKRSVLRPDTLYCGVRKLILNKL